VAPHVRLIAIDIDGTLLDPKFQISAANLDVLGRAHRQGIEIALVTGRRHNFALPVAEALGFPVTLISSNGAVTKRSTGELFHRDLLPANVAIHLVRHMRDFRGNCVITFDRETKGTLICEGVEELNHSIQKWMEKNADYIDFVRPIERAITEDPIQTMFCGTIERMKRAQQQLLTADFLSKITILRTQYEARDLCIVDILNQGCSKGHALERWAIEQGYSRPEIMAIGDNYNDIEMLDFAGLPVIMGNASNDLKHSGYRITLPNDQSGVAHAVSEVLGD
jgi:Cof subfamily protein (haloacid dehalogenase superfamily)